MSSPAPDRTRYSARLDELEALQAKLSGSGPGAERDAMVRRMLEAAGDVLRRSEAIGRGGERAAGALAAIPDEVIESCLRTLPLEDLADRIARAADEAVEAALPEAPEEGATWAGWAMQGLRGRDQLASVMRAAAAKSHRGAQAVRAMQSRLDAFDRRLRPKARWFVALNGTRRAERDLLDVAEREGAWWFSARADCDELLELLAGNAPKTAHLSGCAECRADLSVTRSVETPRQRHLSSEDLWRMDLELLSAAERAGFQSHTERCRSCAEAVRALVAGEQAIVEIAGAGGPTPLRPGDEGRPARPGPVSSAARPRADVQVVDDTRDFRVVVSRQRQRVRVLVQPRRAGRIAAAAMELDGGRPSPRPNPRDEGIEFDLGEETALTGLTARLTIRFTDGAEPFETELDL